LRDALADPTDEEGGIAEQAAVIIGGAGRIGLNMQPSAYRAVSLGLGATGSYRGERGVVLRASAHCATACQ